MSAAAQATTGAIALVGHFPLDEGRLLAVPGGGGRAIAAEVMAAFRQHRHPGLLVGVEAGGLLIGRRLHDGGIVIDELTTPGPNDECRPLSYFRAEEPHASILTERWAASGGSADYLGEWHTHAEAVPHPSALDLATWGEYVERMAQQRRHVLLFVIVGQTHVGVWEGRSC